MLLGPGVPQFVPLEETTNGSKENLTTESCPFGNGSTLNPFSKAEPLKYSKKDRKTCGVRKQS